MKIRQSFVTNSSSSSFLVIIEKNLYDEIKNQIEPEIREWFEKSMISTIFFGTHCNIIQKYCMDNDEFDIFYNLQKKYPEKVFYRNFEE